MNSLPFTAATERVLCEARFSGAKRGTFIVNIGRGKTVDNMGRMWLLFEENLRRFASGDRLLSVVDKARGY